MQTTFSELEYGAKKKLTRRDRFLAEIDALTPWSDLLAALTPFYPKGERVRPPIGVERMLRLYVAQQCFGLSDEGAEDVLYDSQAIRRFVGIDLACESALDATTLLKFGRLLETQNFTKAIFDTINEHLARKGLPLKECRVVDAKIIAAPPPVKNKMQAREPDMHRTKMGNHWHVGMKVNIGPDADSGVVHTLVSTAANVNDVTQSYGLLHGEAKAVHADPGYTGVEKREENRGWSVIWRVAMKPFKRRILLGSWQGNLLNEIESAKASIRAKVEQPFHIVKNLFKHWETRFRCLDKNTAKLYSLFGFANLLIVKKRRMAFNGAMAF